MQSPATNVAEYLEALPEDRRAAITTLRSLLLKKMPKGLSEIMADGMISYVIPHRIYPDGYHVDRTKPLPYLSLASQKKHMAIYLMTLYVAPGMDAFVRDGFAAAGKKLDMGKSCIRFKSLEDLPLDVVTAAVQKIGVSDYIMHYEEGLHASKARKAG